MTKITEEKSQKKSLSTHILTRRMTTSHSHLRSNNYPFNSHPHKEDDGSLWLLHSAHPPFNSHPHKEDDLLHLFRYYPNHTFQLTSSQGGWRCPIHRKYVLWPFNSHPHKEDDNSFWMLLIKPIPFQLTSSQGGWQLSLSTFIEILDLSTHILTRRMTYGNHLFQRTNLSFNSHPHKEDD